MLMCWYLVSHHLCRYTQRSDYLKSSNHFLVPSGFEDELIWFSSWGWRLRLSDVVVGFQVTCIIANTSSFKCFSSLNASLSPKLDQMSVKCVFCKSAIGKISVTYEGIFFLTFHGFGNVPNSWWPQAYCRTANQVIISVHYPLLPFDTQLEQIKTMKSRVIYWLTEFNLKVNVSGISVNFVPLNSWHTFKCCLCFVLVFSWQTCQGLTPRTVFAWLNLGCPSCRVYLQQRHGAENPNQSWSWRSLTRTVWQCFRPLWTLYRSTLVTKTSRTTEVLVASHKRLLSRQTVF